MLTQVITIDGLSATGKSEVGRVLAQHLGWNYLDSGQIYRALAYSLFDQDFVEIHAQGIDIAMGFLDFEFTAQKPDLKISYKGQELTQQELKSALMGQWTSLLAQYPYVQQKILFLLRALAQNARTLIVAGRDSGQSAFPDALCKIYLTSTLFARAEYCCQNEGLSPTPVNLAKFAQKLQARDHRELEQNKIWKLITKDAETIDTTEISVEQVLEIVLTKIHQLAQ